MATENSIDKRLAERRIRAGSVTRKVLEAEATQLPDLSDRVFQPGAEDLERIEREFEEELVRRTARIEQALSEHAETVPDEADETLQIVPPTAEPEE